MVNYCLLNVYFLPDLVARFGRENYRESMKIANRAASSAIAWDQFRYMVFDIPTHTGTYAERYAALGNFFIPHSSSKYIN